MSAAAEAKASPTKPKTVVHDLTNGCAVMLREGMAYPLWYEGKDATKHYLNIDELMTNHLSDETLVEPESDSEKKSWALLPWKLEVSVSLRETIQLFLSYHLKKGQLKYTPHIARMLREFEVTTA